MTVLWTSGCAGIYSAPVMPPQAFVFTNIKAPIDIDANGSPMPSKKGESSSINVLGIVAVGDASVKAAADDGGLVRVEHIDYEFLNVLGVFSKFTVIAYGE
jgi:hypothetical protein